MSDTERLREEDKRDDQAEENRREIYEDRKRKISEINVDTIEQLRRQKEQVDESKRA